MNLADVVAPAVPPELAVLDSAGVICAVNESWLSFAKDNGAPDGWTGVGYSYPGVCDRAGDPTSLAIARAIRAALRGELAGWAAIEVPCHSPRERRWFDVVVSPRFDDAGRPIGAVVSILRIGHREAVPNGRANGRTVSPDNGPTDGPDNGVENGPGNRVENGPDNGSASATVSARPGPGPAGRPASPVLVSMEDYPDALAAVASDGLVVAANLALCRLFGRSREDVVGRPVEELVPPGSRGMHRRVRAGFSYSPRRRAMGQAAQVLAGLHADGRQIPIRVTLSPAELAGRQVLLASVRDVSVMVAAEAQARLVADLLDATTDAIVLHRAEDLRPLWVNRTMAELSGYSRQELLAGRRTGDVLALPELRAAARPLLEGRQDAVQLRGVLTRRNGETVPVELHVVYRERSPGEGYLVAVRRDRTDSERVQAEREQVARLEERARIARDLHDSVIQSLYATGIRLAAAVESVTDPLARQRIVEATTAMDGAISRLRETISRLSEPGTAVPVRDLLEAVLAMRTPPLPHAPTLTITGDPEGLPAPVVDELVQVITEAVSNVARHALARRTDVRLAVDADGAWELVIEDDGEGFDPAVTPRGQGLANLAARAALLGAALSVRSGPREGTRIRLSTRPSGTSA